VAILSEKDILKFLQNLGFSKREIQVYMFLAKSGAQSTSFVAKRLKMERVQAYRTFKKLQEKGFIEATLERPTRFTVVTFESLLDSFIEAKKGEVENLNSQKESLLSSWQSISTPESDYTVAKFSVISGKKKIHSKMVNMITEARAEVYVLTTALGVIQEDLGGVFEPILNSAKGHKLKVKIIADITAENLQIIESLETRIGTKKTTIECRNLNLHSKFFPRFLIKDDEEAILYASSGEEVSILGIEDEGLWINDKMFISILKAFFSQMWQTGAEAKSRIQELKTGIPVTETLVIKDPTDAWIKIEQLIKTAKKDIVIITSSQSLLRLVENDPFLKHHRDGITFRLMAPIDLDNLDAAKKLATIYEIKSVPINYLTMILIDNQNLFMLKSPPLRDPNEESFIYLNEAYFTNDKNSTEPVSEMLNDAWKRGTDLKEITTNAVAIKLPTVGVLLTQTASDLANIMLQKNVNSVLITQQGEPVGLITDREVLREITQNNKNPKSTQIGDLDYTPLLKLHKQQTMTDALKMLTQKGLKRAAVVKDGQLMGMIKQKSHPKIIEKSE
jgi:sugar-specific transcriptional regulator TrmB/CBS domain-containing protein